MRLITLVLIQFFTIFLLSCFGEDDSITQENILKSLNKIKTYEMDVIYSESFAIPSKMRDSIIKGNASRKGTAKLYYLYPNKYSFRNNVIMKYYIDGQVKELIMNFHSVFDGTFYKSRIKLNNKKTVKNRSISVDIALNKNISIGNLNVLGFVDYIAYTSSIKKLLLCSNLIKIDMKGDTIRYKIQYDNERLNNYYDNQGMSPDIKKFFIELMNSRKLEITYDKKLRMVIGYQLVESFQGASIKKECYYKNIKINHKIDDNLFIYKKLENEKFQDALEVLKIIGAMGGL